MSDDLPVPCTSRNVQTNFPSPTRSCVRRTVSLGGRLVGRPTDAFFKHMMNSSVQSRNVRRKSVLIVSGSLRLRSSSLTIYFVSKSFAMGQMQVRPGTI